MSTPLPDPKIAIQQAMDHYTNFEKGKKADQEGLAQSNNIWRSAHGNPFALMMVWLNQILISGDGIGPYAQDLQNKGYGSQGSLLDQTQDQVSEAADGLTFIGALRNADSDIGNHLSNAANTDDPNDLKDIQRDLGYLLPQKEGGYLDFDGIVDSGTENQIVGKIQDLQTQFNTIADPNGAWHGDLNKFEQDVYDKDDTTGAGAINQQITQDLSDVTQGVGLTSQTLQETFQFDSSNVQQFMALWQTIMKSMTTVFTTCIGNQKSGTS